DGSANRKTGRSGADVVIEVPPGTIVREKASGKLVMDLYEAGQRKTLIRGGKGGFGNARFATPVRQAPQFAKPGEKRDVVEVTLELKSIADVGLIGFPNVGKSTILSILTSARPKIANYHFTTLQPNLGIVKTEDDSFIMADIPGLVEGAAQGVGLGYAFLRHVERTRMLLHVIDISGSEYRDPCEDFDIIMKELEAYGDLRERPMIVAANKMDLPDAQEHLNALREKLEPMGIPIYPVSAAYGENGFRELVHAIEAQLKRCPPAEPFAEELLYELSADEENAYSIEKQNGAFIVSGRAVERLIDAVNFDNEESLNFFHRTLRKIGVIDALRAKGAREGDTVVVGDMEFDFVE
ncbi:MAG: GTPase ObgE, partial [Clostridia bacterium]|nr:GTPase ObgE [Clostridia bacterium]